MKKVLNKSKVWTFILGVMMMSTPGCTPEPITPIPATSLQMVRVITDSLTATSGILQRFHRTSAESGWQAVGTPIPVVLGRNGLGWGRGLHPHQPSLKPRKQEGDGRAPAGIFRLTTAFGYEAPDSLQGLKIPYLHNTELLECIDDTESRYYNHVMYRDAVDTLDWSSSERMGYVGAWYAWGVVVAHNQDPVVAGAGSCIFLHNMVDPDETTSGCTELAPAEMEKLIYWLTGDADPILVQLTRSWYHDYQKTWHLPDL